MWERYSIANSTYECTAFVFGDIVDKAKQKANKFLGQFSRFLQRKMQSLEGTFQTPYWF